jgi:GT2 family glycosyltransferase
MNVRPCVTVIIVTYQSSAFIGSCLNSLIQHAADWVARIVVVDNGSTDQCEEVVRKFPTVSFQRMEANLGFGQAVNRGAADAATDYLLILNPDTICDAGTVAELAHFLDYRIQAGACGPFIQLPDGRVDRAARRGFPTPISALGYATRLDRLFPHWKFIGRYHCRWLPVDREVTTEALSGCCMLVRRVAFHQVGGFDPDYFLFGEDIDLCWKLREAGWERWYVPAARLIHVKHASMAFASVRAKHEFFRAMDTFVRKRLASRYSPSAIAIIRCGIKLWSRLTGRW